MQLGFLSLRSRLAFFALDTNGKFSQTRDKKALGWSVVAGAYYCIDQFARNGFNAVGAGSLTLSMPAASGQNGYTPQPSKSIRLYHLISR